MRQWGSYESRRTFDFLRTSAADPGFVGKRSYELTRDACSTQPNLAPGRCGCGYGYRLEHGNGFALGKLAVPAGCSKI